MIEEQSAISLGLALSANETLKELNLSANR